MSELFQPKNDATQQTAIDQNVRRIAIIRPRADSFYWNGLNSTTAYKTHTINSFTTNSDTSLALINTSSNELTLGKGLWKLKVPVSGYNTFGSIDFRMYNSTNLAVAYETLGVVDANGASVPRITTDIDILIQTTTSTAFKFQTKASSTTGIEYIGFITLEKIG